MTDLNTAVEAQDANELNRDPITGAPGAHPIGTGIGAATGALAGAAMGIAGGPIGTAVGGLVGSIVGGLAGKGVGEVMKPTMDDAYRGTEYPADDVVALQPSQADASPTAEDLYWQRAFITEPYYNSELAYDDYAPAYRMGFNDRMNSGNRTWEESEVALQTEWERSKGTSRLSWEDAKQAAQAAWFRTHQSIVDPPRFEVH